MFTDDQLLPVSALQHFVFCPRRAALVHLECVWADNRFTAEGRRLHRVVDDPRRGEENRPGLRVARGLEIHSHRHGLVGKADVVEFHDAGPGRAPRIIIVEYKRGRPKPALDQPFRVQLCAQALCLEEMLDTQIPQGAIFFGRQRRRTEVVFDAALRGHTLRAIEGLHNLIRSGRTPPAKFQRKCRRCSLLNLCLPKAMRPRATAARYLAQAIAQTERDAATDATPDAGAPLAPPDLPAAADSAGPDAEMPAAGSDTRASPAHELPPAGPADTREHPPP